MTMELHPEEISSRMLASAPECQRLCSICGASMCITTSHQPWQCECGHPRRDHFMYILAQYGASASYTHPHPCQNLACDCQAYVVPVHFLLTDDEVIADLRSLESELRLDVHD